MFKEKKTKKAKAHRSANLDNLHQSQVKSFAKLESSIPTLKNKLLKIDKQIAKLEAIEIKSFEELNSLRVLRLERSKLDSQIKNNEEYATEMDYYSATHDVLSNYYEFDGQKKSTITIEDFYHNTACDEEVNQKILLDKYLEIVRPDEADIGKRRAGEMLCECCNTEMNIDNGKNWCCPKCGFIVQSLSEAEAVKSNQSNFAFQYDTNKYSVYQRINHFKEWLNQIQAKENTDIPDTVIDAVKGELKKMMYENIEDLSHSQVRSILKKLGLAKYYENIFYIIHKINGLAPPTLNHDTEQRLIQLFKQIEEPFHMYKNKERKNILRYGYILYKLCELLELDDILPCFKLLKNRAKLIKQDVIWKKICAHNRWQFIESL